MKNVQLLELYFEGQVFRTDNVPKTFSELNQLMAQNLNKEPNLNLKI